MKFAFLSAALVSVLFVNSASAQYYYVQPGCANGQCPQTYAAPRPAVQYYAPPVTYQQPTSQAYQSNCDPGTFLNWLNQTRAAYGLPAVAYDQNLANWAHANNVQQHSRGMGHHVLPCRRQNAGWGNLSSVPGMWMASPGHRAALLDPSIRWIGIASLGAYVTFNAN